MKHLSVARCRQVVEIIVAVAFLASRQPSAPPTVPSRRTTLVDCAPYYKDAMLGRFYAICNCCSCCCGAMNAHRNGTPMVASSGYVAVVDDDLCAGCGSCAEGCQFSAISVDTGLAQIENSVCMGCGVCMARCPQEAISLVRDPAKGEPLEIQRLIAEAAVTVIT